MRAPSQRDCRRALPRFFARTRRRDGGGGAGGEAATMSLPILRCRDPVRTGRGVRAPAHAPDRGPAGLRCAAADAPGHGRFGDRAQRISIRRRAAAWSSPWKARRAPQILVIRISDQRPGHPRSGPHSERRIFVQDRHGAGHRGRAAADGPLRDPIRRRQRAPASPCASCCRARRRW